MKQKIGQVFLWISVIAWSLWFGGLMYETIVIMPVWSADLPQSVIEWNSRPNFMLNPTKFYVPIVITVILSSLVGLILGWKSDNKRLWLILSTFSAITAFVFTIVYFFPKNDILFRNQYIGLSGEEISNIAYSWITANWIRICLMAVGFFSALRVYNADSK